MVDTPVLGTGSVRNGGSSPLPPTTAREEMVRKLAYSLSPNAAGVSKIQTKLYYP